MPHVIRLALFNICYAMRLSRLPYMPLVINLEPTNHCNLRCPMCPVAHNATNPSVSRGFMEWSVFERIAAQLESFCPDVAINLGGESTLHPELSSMIRRLKDGGMYVFLDTNATRLTDEQCLELISSGLDKIVFCLDGDDRASYESMRARASFDDTVTNIQRFLKLRNDRGARRPKTVVKNIRPYNSSTAAEFPAAFQSLFRECPPDKYLATYADYWPGSHADEAAALYQIQPVSDEYSPCINLWKKLPISWDGMVYICCLDLNRTTAVGDLTRQAISDVWNSPVMISHRIAHAQHQQATLNLCKNCNQVRRRPSSSWAGLIDARGDRFTAWSHTSHDNNK